MRALLVVNPSATSTTPGTRDVLVGALGADLKLDVVETVGPGHASELAAAAARDGCDLVVAHGGDGTLNEVVNGLLTKGPGPQTPALAVVPGGSGNVVARSLGVPGDPVEATGHLLTALRAGRSRRIGLGRVDNGRWFVFCAGLGLDARVVGRVESLRAAGRRATTGRYVRVALTRYLGEAVRRPEIRITSGRSDPDLRPEGGVRVRLALVCNTRPWSYLGRRAVVPCPDASYARGLDAFGLTSLDPVTVARVLAQMLSARPDPRGPGVVRFHDEEALLLSSDRPEPFQVDGDLLGERTEVSLRSVPNALRLVC